MSEKRFTHQRTDDYNFSDILDNGKWIGICHVDCEDDFVDKFNELNDENKLLLRKNGAMEEEIECLTEENKKLKEILKYTYEIHECETCKYNESFNWLDPATMNREYDSRCGKGLHYGDEVHGCEEYELDLEMFKKRVKR